MIISTANKRNFAIGVFDSGLGGLTVVKELRRQLPFENIVYFGDTARVPYGTKSKETIIRFSKENTRILLKHKVKCVVVACNSCSSYAMPILKRNFSLPILGVLVPSAKKATSQTRNNRVGVIATSATIASGQYPKTIKRFRKSAQVFTQACPMFVPLVEEGWFNKRIALDVADSYLQALKKRKVDTLILGCTHYPLLKNTLRKTMGQKVTLIDSAKEVASEVKDTLSRLGLVNRKHSRGKVKFLISDKPQQFKKIARTFLGFDIDHVQTIKGV
ncbi:MAG TPA: glutamate racemase [Candidatus Omnitrophota bacterium]|nr:glutamate racemase [Candidatus Omnitrophota bacterium]